MNSNGWHKAQWNSCGQMCSTLNPTDFCERSDGHPSCESQVATYNSCHFENVFHNNLKCVTFSERKLRVPTTRQLSSYQNDDLIQPNRLSLFARSDLQLQKILVKPLEIKLATQWHVSCISTENIRSPACFCNNQNDETIYKIRFYENIKVELLLEGRS